MTYLALSISGSRVRRMNLSGLRSTSTPSFTAAAVTGRGVDPNEPTVRSRVSISYECE